MRYSSHGTTANANDFSTVNRTIGVSQVITNKWPECTPMARFIPEESGLCLCGRRRRENRLLRSFRGHPFEPVLEEGPTGPSGPQLGQGVDDRSDPVYLVAQVSLDESIKNKSKINQRCNV